MKIFILTLPLNVNYGGILQAYALQTVLQRLGHEVTVIDKNLKPKRMATFLKMPLRLLKKYVFRENVPIFHERLLYTNYLHSTTYTRAFIEKHVHRQPVYSLTELRKESIDALVIGSDQVWRPIYFKAVSFNLCDAFGDFACKWNIKICSYAASFGLDHLNEYPKELIPRIKQLLSSFSGISVRESSAVALCKETFGIQPIHVLDPTMLLDFKDYCRLIPADTMKQHGIMCYILDDFPLKEEFLDMLKTGLNLPVFSVIAQHANDVQPPLENWLSGFRDASVVVTDSFHACVFSILSHTPFWVVLNPDRGTARIHSLLSLFHLEHRIICNCKDFTLSAEQDIDWKQVDSILESRRVLSKEFLNSMLK